LLVPFLAEAKLDSRKKGDRGKEQAGGDGSRRGKSNQVKKGGSKGNAWGQVGNGEGSIKSPKGKDERGGKQEKGRKLSETGLKRGKPHSTT